LGETRSNRERRLRIGRPVKFGVRAAVIAHRRWPPRRRFAGVGQSRPSGLNSRWGLAGEKARDTPNLPRGSLGHGTAANSYYGGKPVRARWCSVMMTFCPRAGLQATTSTLRARGDWGGAHRGTNLAVLPCGVPASRSSGGAHGVIVDRLR
jgi:hypothetical protein